MTDPTRTTGATPGQLGAAAIRRLDDLDPSVLKATGHWNDVEIMEFFAQYLVPPDQCIVPRSFVAAFDRARRAAEELDFTDPGVRIPIGRWHDVENARDTFREDGE